MMLQSMASVHRDEAVLLNQIEAVNWRNDVNVAVPIWQVLRSEQQSGLYFAEHTANSRGI